MQSSSAFSKLRDRLALYGLDGFILGILIMVLFAWLKPEWGSSESPLPLKKITGIGVSVIFFFYGLKLSPEKLKGGLKNIPLHILIQISTFLIFPAIAWIAFFLISPEPGDHLWLGIFFLAALPSTVSSSVVMVSIAGGNIPAAIFNASISSLIGVVMTPFWMGLVISTSGMEMDALQVIIDLFLKVIVPVIGGIFLHPYLGKWVIMAGSKLKLFDQSIILLIVFMSFAESFALDLYAGISSLKLVSLAIAMLLLFGLVLAIDWLVSRLMKFNKEDTITAIFCGSKKSLVHGTVMANVLFKGSPLAGIILLPIMVYHTIQLVTASIIAQRIAKKG